MMPSRGGSPAAVGVVGKIMVAKTVSELLSQWYASSEEDFLAAHLDPVLIGVGILDVQLLRVPHREADTPCLGFQLATSGNDAPSHPLVGTIITISPRAPGGPQPQQLTLGRAENADVMIDDVAVSETHCILERHGEEELLVTDLGSTNGTLINGVPLEPSLNHLLRNEDVITVGRHSFQYFTPSILFRYLQLSPGAPR